MDSQLAEVITLESAAVHHHVSVDVMRQFVMDGDLSKIAPAMRPDLIMALNRHLGLDPIERAFMVFNDGKKTVLYATRACTSALCRERRISRKVTSLEERVIAGQPMIIATARATLEETGRYDESTGVVPVMQAEVEWTEGRDGKRHKNVVGWRMPDPTEAANLPMKAETKAKRRAVLDLVGLGMPDESELEGIRGARRGRVDMASGEISFGEQPALSPAPIDPATEALAGVLRKLDASVTELAELRELKKNVVFRLAVRTAGLDPDAITRPADLDHMQAVAVLDVVDTKLADLRGEQRIDPAANIAPAITCAELYDKLCEAAPGDYEPDNFRREWANMLALDEWPAQPTAAQYGEVAEHITRILEKLSE